MTTYSFRLRIEGVTYDGFESFADAMFSPEVDCTVSFRDHAAGVHFNWESDTLRDALLAAIAHVHKADPSVRVVALELEEGRTLDEAFAA